MAWKEAEYADTSPKSTVKSTIVFIGGRHRPPTLGDVVRVLDAKLYPIEGAVRTQPRPMVPHLRFIIMFSWVVPSVS